ncbi:helix-turn-helix domain-containing protein [Gayadomonas joobiniege]|uniref:helix-turn-helix domain-containing protein n=1 Tax=Gayadomonas joobiniege TaxID=1234606 RepID=UPI000380DA61|nr:helix-turn-helix domain-containing protein [Gayadomonas joobiniege]
MNTDTQQEPEETSPTSQIGTALRQARQTLGLSELDVANSLNLKAETVSQLETEQFDKIVSPTYVKGYLRSYAKLVDLNPEHIVEQYKKSQPQATQSKNRLHGLTSKNVVESADAKFGWVGTILVIIIIALIAFWWWQGQPTTVSQSGWQPESSVELQQNS